MLVSVIGTRRLSPGWRKLLLEFSRAMSEAGWWVRTGAATGCDQTWAEHMRGPQVSLYLPWPTYEKEWWQGSGYRIQYRPTKEAEKITARYYPRPWKEVKPGVRLLHARNVHIILGPKCDKPADLVLCYTVDGGVSGGTGQGIRIAEGFGIPVLNVHWPQHQVLLQELLDGSLLLEDLEEHMTRQTSLDI